MFLFSVRYKSVKASGVKFILTLRSGRGTVALFDPVAVVFPGEVIFVVSTQYDESLYNRHKVEHPFSLHIYRKRRYCTKLVSHLQHNK